MAEKADIERLVGRVLLDERFRQAFLDDPVAAAAEMGIRLDAQEVERAKTVDRDRLNQLVNDVATISVSGPYAWG